MSNLNYRRAKFVYEGARLAAEAAGAPIVPEPYDDREEAFRLQFEKVIERQMGPDRSADAESLHEDWVKAYEAMGWVYGPKRDVEAKTHPDMVPYNELGQLERDKDEVFVALCEIARLWVYDGMSEGQAALTFRRLQLEVGSWSRHNFGDQPAYRPLLGAVEEVGELAHSHLKMEQGIRGSAEEHIAKAKDAVGDILVYLADYCARREFDMQSIIDEVWGKVKQRDWKKDPTTGGDLDAKED